MGTMMDFESEIKAIINKHSQENLSNTPDFILATYLIDCMNAFDTAVNHREKWYGREVSGEAGLEALADLPVEQQEQDGE